MQQAHLVIFANHTIDCSCKENFLPCFLSIDQTAITDYLNKYMCLSNCEDRVEPFVWIEENALPYRFLFYGIEVKMEKNLIQMKFPFIFRAIVDFVPLRTALLQLCQTLLPALGTSEMVFCPSFWQQTALECHTEWGEKRLLQMQEKIMNKATSYKRTKLNLAHCMGAALEDFALFPDKKYRGWLIYDLSRR